jgi:hypothetical protein
MCYKIGCGATEQFGCGCGCDCSDDGVNFFGSILDNAHHVAQVMQGLNHTAQYHYSHTFCDPTSTIVTLPGNATLDNACACASGYHTKVSTTADGTVTESCAICPPGSTCGQEVSFVFSVSGLTLAAVQANLATYAQALADVLGVAVSDITLTATATSRRLVEGISEVEITAAIAIAAPVADTADSTGEAPVMTAAMVETAVMEPSFVTTVVAELETAGVTATVAVDTTTLAVAAAAPKACGPNTYQDSEGETTCKAHTTCDAASTVASPGDATTDTTCACSSGFHTLSGGTKKSCTKHTVCEAASTVASPGDATTDTTCACSSGFHTIATKAIAKTCERNLNNKAIHWAEQAANGNWGPYLGETGKPFASTEAECQTACEGNAACKGWSYRYGESSHEHFNKCFLLDAAGISHGAKNAVGKFHSSICATHVEACTTCSAGSTCAGGAAGEEACPDDFTCAGGAAAPVAHTVCDAASTVASCSLRRIRPVTGKGRLRLVSRPCSTSCSVDQC